MQNSRNFKRRENSIDYIERAQIYDNIMYLISVYNNIIEAEKNDKGSIRIRTLGE